MPTVTREGVSLYYETDGSGETVAFVTDAGFGAWLWGFQYAQVAGPFETLVWDLPGTGRSADPRSPVDVDALAADFEGILAAAGVERAHVVGAGLGGMVALRHARESDRARTLTLFGTARSGGAVDESALRALYPDRDEGRDPGDGGHSEDAFRASLAGALSRDFLDSRPDIVADICGWRAEEDATGRALEAQLGAMLGFEAGPLYELDRPTLVCHGVDDPVVPERAGRKLAGDLPRGSYEPVEGRRLCFVEHARAVTDRLVGHIEEHGF